MIAVNLVHIHCTRTTDTLSIHCTRTTQAPSITRPRDIGIEIAFFKNTTVSTPSVDMKLGNEHL